MQHDPMGSRPAMGTVEGSSSWPSTVKTERARSIPSCSTSFLTCWQSNAVALARGSHQNEAEEP